MNYYMRFTDGERQMVNVGKDPVQALNTAERKETEP
jgi:hypothetical protein